MKITVFYFNIFCNNVKVYTVTFDQFNANLITFIAVKWIKLD